MKIKKIIRVEKEQSSLFSFSLALELLKEGCKVARVGWNGEGMWLRLIKPEGADLTTGLDNLPYIEMKTADDKLVPWTASQTDMLAEDWRLVKTEQVSDDEDLCEFFGIGK